MHNHSAAKQSLNTVMYLYNQKFSTQFSYSQKVGINLHAEKQNLMKLSGLLHIFSLWMTQHSYACRVLSS